MTCYIGTTKYQYDYTTTLLPFLFIHFDASDRNTHADGVLHTE